MLTSFFAVTLCSIIKTQKQNKPQQNVQAADLTISNFSQLKSFASAVNSGNTYSGKTVELTANIDCGGADLSCIGSYTNPAGNSDLKNYFDGVFDGQGYTISNFRLIDGYKYFIVIDRAPTEWRIMGFFAIIGSNARIKNLHLNSFNVYANLPTGDREAWGGGLIGASRSKITVRGSANHNSNPTIENCKVTNFSSTINRRDNIAGILGLGSANIKNCFVDGLTNCDYSFGPVSSSVTLRPKSALIGDYSLKIESDNVSVQGCVTKSTLYQLYDSNKASNCKTTANNVSGLSYSATGGKDVSQPWYYHSSYNSGWPMLRVFMGWKTVNFTAGTGGSVSPTSIQIPSDSNPTATQSGSTIAILGQTSTATASSGYSFSGWSGSGTSYTANFKRLSATLTFSKPKDKNGNIVNDAEITINVYGPKDPTAPIKIEYERAITVSAVTASGPKSFTYNFTDADGYNTTVTYYIPDKYNLVNSNNPGSVSTATATITPTIEIKPFTVTLKAATGSNRTTDEKWTVEYGQSVTYNSSNLSFTFNGSTITYTASSGYRYEGLTIKRNNTTSNTNALTGITGNIEIQPVFARWFEVTFATIGNTTAPTSAHKIEVKENDSITQTLSADQKTLTYSYNGSSVTYRASKFYILSNGSNVLKVTGTKTITPVTTFYACMVTMGSIGTGVGTRAVSGDNYGTASDGIFAVEFGTTVTFSVERISAGMYKYIYTFSSGEVVSYSITNNQYAMQYTLNAQGERTGMENGLNGLLDTDSYTFAAGTTSKSISPTFDKKQYVGELG